MLEKAADLIENREDDLPGNLLEAKALLEKETSGADAGKACTLLSEALFWLGEYAPSKEEKETFFGEGVEVGKKAVELEPDAVAAHLWYAANMGAHGMSRGIMSSLFYLGPIDQHGKKALALDENYFFGAPLRLMGRYYHQAPGWPVGKGDLSKGIKHLERAVKAGPTFLLNHLYLAEAYIARRKKREAAALLDEIENAEVTMYPAYHQRIKADAKELRAKV